MQEEGVSWRRHRKAIEKGESRMLNNVSGNDKYGAQPPSTDGKHHFVGCTDWRKAEKWEHLYIPIPSWVDEAILLQLVNNKHINSLDLAEYEGGCSAFVHPRHGKQKYCSQ